MKRNYKALIGASAVSLLAFSAMAQDAANSRTDGPGYHESLMRRVQRADRLNGAA
jgi:Spy/CpxP family protein refolding chaperone